MLAFALVLPALSACEGAQALDPATADSLQQQVRELATLTQEGNLEGALSQADALKADVQAAEDSGGVTPGRALRIQDNIDAYIASIQVEVPAPAPATVPPAEPAPVPTITAPAKGDKEDGRGPGETQSDREREASEEAAEEAQKQAEKEEKERQKQEEDREDD